MRLIIGDLSRRSVTNTSLSDYDVGELQGKDLDGESSPEEYKKGRMPLHCFFVIDLLYIC